MAMFWPTRQNSMDQVSFLQLNCNKSRATSTCLTQMLAEGKNQIALLQEPHEYKGSVTNLDPSLAKLHVTGGGRSGYGQLLLPTLLFPSGLPQSIPQRIWRWLY